MKAIFYLLLTVVASGCVSVSTISTNVSEPRPAVPVKNVCLALTAPPNAALIADIISEAENSEKGADAAQVDLKRKAASLGANLIVIRRSNQGVDFSSFGPFRIEADVYFVPQ
jgi:hypothetical protein